ncbi:MAG: protein-export chaperone SecB [Alphaproteobacteria bacterium]
MAEIPPTQPPNAGQPAATEEPRLTLHVQYIKDLSFENPNAPQSLLRADKRPPLQVQIDIQTRRLGPTRHEVSLQLKASARNEERVAFILELDYGGVFTVSGFPDEATEEILLIECPSILFPFARRVLADAVRDGGFPPLMLDPVDFRALYRQRSVAEANENKGS